MVLLGFDSQDGSTARLTLAGNGGLRSSWAWLIFIMVYENYIRSSKWKKKRMERLSIDGNKCVRCGHDGSQYRLEIHHKTYERFTNELMEDLETLCVPCHDIETNRMRFEKYSKRKILLIKTQKSTPNGKFESQANKCMPNVNAQWTNCRPPKPIFVGYEGGIIKKKKD